MDKRVGVYMWAGPGTVRMIHTKYGNVSIDTESFLRAYSNKYIQDLVQKFGVTDVWITYSWGFSSTTERDDQRFFLDSLPIFAKYGIRTHGYIQGLNLVSSEFVDKDYWCRDLYGNTIPYSPGRLYACPNNPCVQDVILSRAEALCETQCFGVYLDNLLFGLPPWFLFREQTSFYGCACSYCSELFTKRYNYPLIEVFRSKERRSDYNEFRTDSTTHIISQISSICKKHKKEFGINLTDPVLRHPPTFYGYDRKKIDPYLDYYLVENHNLPRKNFSNTHLSTLIQETKKPVFIVSYKDGIGDEENFSQNDVDVIFSESVSLGYFPCLKVSEFTTHGVWHMLDMSHVHKPKTIPLPPPRLLQKLNTQNPPLFLFLLLWWAQKYVLILLYFFQSHAWLYRRLHKSAMYKNMLIQPRQYDAFE